MNKLYPSDVQHLQDQLAAITRQRDIAVAALKVIMLNPQLLRLAPARIAKASLDQIEGEEK